MGTGLEMKRLNIRGRWASLLAAVLIVTGCGNTPGQVDHVQMLTQLIPRGQPGSDTVQSVTDPALLLSQTTEPLTLVRPDNGSTPFYLLGVRDNGVYRTYITGTRQSMTMLQGIVTGTRGLGWDLMASDITPLLARLRSGQDGPAQRVMHYLDGEDVIRDLVLDCIIAFGSTVRVQAGETDQTGRRMTETCETGPLRFENSYVVTAAGQVIQSKQWLSPGAGSMTFDVLRP
jgi:hypothetical protein